MNKVVTFVVGAVTVVVILAVCNLALQVASIALSGEGETMMCPNQSVCIDQGDQFQFNFFSFGNSVDQTGVEEPRSGYGNGGPLNGLARILENENFWVWFILLGSFFLGALYLKYG